MGPEDTLLSARIFPMDQWCFADTQPSGACITFPGAGEKSSFPSPNLRISFSSFSSPFPPAPRDNTHFITLFSCWNDPDPDLTRPSREASKTGTITPLAWTANGGFPWAYRRRLRDREASLGRWLGEGTDDQMKHRSAAHLQCDSDI